MMHQLAKQGRAGKCVGCTIGSQSEMILIVSLVVFASMAAVLTAATVIYSYFD